jgi:hypothetical protein
VKKEILTTLTFGFFSALSVIPFTFFFAGTWGGDSGWTLFFNLFLWLNLVLYSFFLCRWSKTRMVPLFPPLLFVLGAALWPGNSSGFILIILCVFSWVRSAFCYSGTVVRTVVAESLTIGGGAGLLLFWWPGSDLVFPAALWMFFLVQTLYFFIIPGRMHDSIPDPVDPFERACREMERILDVDQTGFDSIV